MFHSPNIFILRFPSGHINNNLVSRAPCYCNWASNHRTGKFKALCLIKVAFPQKYYFQLSTKYPKHIHDTSFFLLKKKLLVYKIKTGFIPSLLFFWAMLCFGHQQGADSLDKIGLDFHVPIQRYQVETQKDEALFF